MIASALAAGTASADVEGRACTVPSAEREATMREDYAAFDQAAMPHSWRNLLQQGCTREAVGILEDYRKWDAARLTRDQRLELNFHIGQTLAFGGYDAEALPHFEIARADGAPEEWNAYVDATVAFLKKDRPRLEEARRRYVSAADHQDIRVKLIDGFLQCLDKPYAAAVHCAVGGVR
jgi:hypothetical protein